MSASLSVVDSSGWLEYLANAVAGEKAVMSTISLRLPESLHERVRAVAEREGVSINQLITIALAEKLSALLT